MSLTSYEEKRLQEIRNFEECLQDGFELYTTGRSVMEYHFGSKKLKQVFEAAFRSQELRNECIDLAERLFFIIERDIVKHMKNQLENGFTREESKLFIRRMIVFWQIYELEHIDGLLGDEMKNKFHALHSQIDQSISHFKDKAEWKNLPSDLISSFQSMSIYDRSSPILQMNRLEQNDVDIYKTEFEEDPEEKISTEFINRVNTILDGLLNENFIMDEVRELNDAPCFLKSNDSVTLLNRLIDAWKSLIQSNNKCVQEGALRVLRFILLTCKERDNIVHAFHNMYMEKELSLPSFTQSPLLPEGKKLITSLINDMKGHDEMQRDHERSRSVLDKFHWLVTVSPEETICCLLQRCFIDKKIVAPSVKLLSSLPSLSTLTSLSSNALILSSLISIARSADYSIVDEREALVYLIASLTRQKKNGSDRPVIDTHKVFDLFVTRPIASKDEDKLSVALALLIRLFSTGETKHSVIHFSRSIGQKNEGEVSGPDLLVFLMDVMGRTEEAGKTTLFELTKKTIKQMGSKLREDGIVWEDESCTYILNRLSHHQWFVKVAITQWFSSVLGDPLRQIPSGLLACLSSEHTSLFDQILVPFQFSPVECFLRSLYEVSIWDLPFALSFLDLGVTVAPLDDNMADKISIAIVDVSCNTRCAQWQTLVPFVPLTQRLVNILDVTIDCRLERINGAIYHSIYNQRALNIVARATKLAFLTNEDDEGRDNHWALLQLFCSISKSYIEGEMESWRRFQKMKAKDAFNGTTTIESNSEMEKVSSTEYVLTQCATLFPLAVSLTHIVPKIPPSLQVLLSTISGYLSEFYNRPFPTCLDNAPTGSVTDTTVYAYARGANPSNGDNEKPKKEHSATNQLFDMNGRNQSMGTARAINDPSMSAIIENKLAPRMEEKKEDKWNGGKGTYSGYSNTNNANKKRNKNRKK